MNRRKAIGNLVTAASGIIILPAWMAGCGISDSTTHNSSFTGKEQQTLAAVADAIIPAGNAVGALAVGVDKYLQKLFDDCYEQPVQTNIKKQLQALETVGSGSPMQEALKKLAVSPVKEEKDFFDLVKSETIRGFTTSQKVMEDYLGYKVAPGHYHGCVPTKQ